MDFILCEFLSGQLGSFKVSKLLQMVGRRRQKTEKKVSKEEEEAESDLEQRKRDLGEGNTLDGDTGHFGDKLVEDLKHLSDNSDRKDVDVDGAEGDISKERNVEYSVHVLR